MNAARTVAVNVARNELENDLGDNGGYVNAVAKGDVVTVDLSGYPFYSATSVPDFSGVSGGLRRRKLQVAPSAAPSAVLGCRSAVLPP